MLATNESIYTAPVHVGAMYVTHDQLNQELEHIGAVVERVRQMLNDATPKLNSMSMSDRRDLMYTAVNKVKAIEFQLMSTIRQL